MALHAVAACLVGHGAAAERPLGVAVGIAALGEVHDLRAVGLDGGDVGVVPSAVADVGYQQPLAVGAPFERHVAVGVGVVVFPVERRDGLLRLEVDDLERGAVFKEGYLLAVGREGGLLGHTVAFVERLLDNLGGVCETLLGRVLDLGREELPLAVAVGVVDEFAAVGRERHDPLLGGGVGDAACGLVFGVGHVYLAAQHECDLLAVRRHGHIGCVAVLERLDGVPDILVGVDVDIELGRLRAFAHCVDVAVPAEHEQSIARGRERAHRVTLERCELHGLGAFGSGIDVERARLLADIPVSLAVGFPDGVEVVAVEGGEFLEAALVVDPDVGRSRRAFVLAVYVFEALLVLVDDPAVGGDGSGADRHGEE